MLINFCQTTLSLTLVVSSDVLFFFFFALIFSYSISLFENSGHTVLILFFFLMTHFGVHDLHLSCMSAIIPSPPSLHRNGDRAPPG